MNNPNPHRLITARLYLCNSLEMTKGQNGRLALVAAGGLDGRLGRRVGEGGGCAYEKGGDPRGDENVLHLNCIHVDFLFAICTAVLQHVNCWGKLSE